MRDNVNKVFEDTNDFFPIDIFHSWLLGPSDSVLGSMEGVNLGSQKVPQVNCWDTISFLVTAKFVLVSRPVMGKKDEDDARLHLQLNRFSSPFPADAAQIEEDHVKNKM